jgi:hypothetical protein
MKSLVQEALQSLDFTLWTKYVCSSMRKILPRTNNLVLFQAEAASGIAAAVEAAFKRAQELAQ